MAKSPESSTKEPGRIRQIVDIIKMTAKYDKPGVVMMVVAAVLPIVAAFLLCFFVNRTSVIFWIIFMLLGVLVGLLLFMFVRLTRYRHGRGRSPSETRINEAWEPVRNRCAIRERFHEPAQLPARLGSCERQDRVAHLADRSEIFLNREIASHPAKFIKIDAVRPVVDPRVAERIKPARTQSEMTVSEQALMCAEDSFQQRHK